MTTAHDNSPGSSNNSHHSQVVYVLFLLFLLTAAGATADHLLASLRWEAARWVSQAVFAGAVGWSLLSQFLYAAPAPFDSTATSGSAEAEPAALPVVTRRAATRRSALAAAAPAGGDAAEGSALGSDAAAAVGGAAADYLDGAEEEDSDGASSSASAPAHTPMTRAAAAFARVLAARFRASPNTLRFAPYTCTFPYPWDAVMAAADVKMRPPNDPLNPSVLSVKEIAALEEGEDVAELDFNGGGGGGSRSGSRRAPLLVRRRTRDIESSIVQWVPSALRWAFPVESITLREELSAIPAAHWALLRLRSMNLSSVGAIQVRGGVGVAFVACVH